MKTRYLPPLLVLALIGIVLVVSNTPSAPNDLDLRNSFALLRSSPESPRSTEDKHIVNNIRFVDPKAQPLSTRLAFRRTGLWVVTTKDLVCISESRGAACRSREQAGRKGVILGTFLPPTRPQPRPHSFRLQGLVPDRAERALLIVGMRRFAVKVRHNVFSVERNKPIHLIRLLRN